MSLFQTTLYLDYLAPLPKQNVLATAGINCTIILPLSDVVEDCSVVQVQQLQMLYH